MELTDKQASSGSFDAQCTTDGNNIDTSSQRLYRMKVSRTSKLITAEFLT